MAEGQGEAGMYYFLWWRYFELRLGSREFWSFVASSHHIDGVLSSFSIMTLHTPEELMNILHFLFFYHCCG